MPELTYCDCHNDRPRQVKKLLYNDETRGSIILCFTGWQEEMRWRRERNRRLDKDLQYSIISWDITNIYTEGE
jgi:hypothetical protein